jgi:hypothetical protein
MWFIFIWYAFHYSISENHSLWHLADLIVEVLAGTPLTAKWVAGGIQPPHRRLDRRPYPPCLEHDGTLVPSVGKINYSSPIITYLLFPPFFLVFLVICRKNIAGVKNSTFFLLTHSHLLVIKVSSDQLIVAEAISNRLIGEIWLFTD